MESHDFTRTTWTGMQHLVLWNLPICCWNLQSDGLGDAGESRAMAPGTDVLGVNRKYQPKRASRDQRAVRIVVW